MCHHLENGGGLCKAVERASEDSKMPAHAATMGSKTDFLKMF